jgi:hypothetical protein
MEMKMNRFGLASVWLAFAAMSGQAQNLDQSFRNPPDAVRPWVIWHWVNGNISRHGITADLEAMKAVGLGGVIQMEISGPKWAPLGTIVGETAEWHDAMQWSIAEAKRLGLDYDLTIDFGYGSGGAHITPDISMQQLVWSETAISGGQAVKTPLEKPVFSSSEELERVWLRPGEQINPQVLRDIKEIDSYRDVAVFAFPQPASDQGRNYRIPELEQYDGRGWTTPVPPIETATIPADAPIPQDGIIDLTAFMQPDGTLCWDAPPGQWQVVRLGHASNFKMTRPCPQSAVGLECDRLNPRGIETHFEKHLKPILEQAGSRVGTTLQYLFLDSWEAHGQNWTAGFAAEFRKRRGYDIHPWLPVLTGRIVGNADLTQRFLWDMRQTVSDMTLDNYIDRLRELARPYGLGFSNEPYGNVCVDSLDWAGRVDFPVCEFWTQLTVPKPFPTFGSRWYTSMKALASVANTYGKTRVGAEAFTGARGWMDHPYLLKGMGDEAFANGVNHYTIHSSAHQAYDSMVPGLTHRKWGQHFQRHQTWWKFSRPYFDYVTRCQFLLQQGRRAVDVAWLYQEGAPFHLAEIPMNMPRGYDFDLCSSPIIQRMEFRDGRIHLPDGVSYRYLALPENGRLTLPTARKIQQLHEAGARIVLLSTIAGTPDLEGYPQADQTVRQLAANWDSDRALEKGWQGLFDTDALAPDFEGAGLNYTHRRVGETEIYFVANPEPEQLEKECLFRITGKTPELWNPETGEILPLSNVRKTGGRTAVTLRFEPMQSWFVVFRQAGGPPADGHQLFPEFKPVREITGPWTLAFDPKWGSKAPIQLTQLGSWSEQADPLVKYYSGTGTYSCEFELAKTGAEIFLDLGEVAVMARVRLNGKDCGIAWKPPYRVDISDAVKPGKNKLTIEVVNTWVNRMIGDEQLPLDSEWKTMETLIEWPDWFKEGKPSPAGRYTFTSSRHYTKDDPLHLSGLLGPVRIMQQVDRNTARRE